MLKDTAQALIQVKMERLLEMEVELQAVLNDITEALEDFNEQLERIVKEL